MKYIMDRVYAKNGGIVRDKWDLIVRPRGGLEDKDILWLKKNKARLMGELWPEYDEFEKRLAVYQTGHGMSAQEAREKAYAEVTNAAL